MSPGHFSRSFRAAFGETPYSYLMTRRIERAKALLRRGDLSVTEVCFEVGCLLPRVVQLAVHRDWSARAPAPIGPAATTRAPPSRRASPRSTPDRSGFEKRSCLPVRHVKRMTSTSHVFHRRRRHDKALAFYGDVLGLEVGNDGRVRGNGWVTVSSPSRPDVDITLDPASGGPHASYADKEAAAGSWPRGYARVIFAPTTSTPPSSGSARGWRRAAGADRHAVRRPRLRLPRSGRRHAALGQPR